MIWLFSVFWGLSLGVSLYAVLWARRELRWIREQRDAMAQAQKDFDERIAKLLSPNPTPCDRPATPLRLVRGREDDVS
jgi:hypothetical protein